MNSNPITATVDFEKDGVQHGFLRLPHSRDDSAWGSIMIPICVGERRDRTNRLADRGKSRRGI